MCEYRKKNAWVIYRMVKALAYINCKLDDRKTFPSFFVTHFFNGQFGI